MVDIIKETEDEANPMALTATQRLQVKKHLAVWPHDDIIDASIEALEDGAEKEAELVAAVALCETRYTAINTAVAGSDELKAGGGAKFDYENQITTRQRWYEDAVKDLARLIGIPMNDVQASRVTNWRIM